MPNKKKTEKPVEDQLSKILADLAQVEKNIPDVSNRTTAFEPLPVTPRGQRTTFAPDTRSIDTLGVEASQNAAAYDEQMRQAREYLAAQQAQYLASIVDYGSLHKAATQASADMEKKYASDLTIANVFKQAPGVVIDTGIDWGLKALTGIMQTAVLTTSPSAMNAAGFASAATGGMAAGATAAPVPTEELLQQAMQDSPVGQFGTWFDQTLWEPGTRYLSAGLLTTGEIARQSRLGNQFDLGNVWRRAYNAADRKNLGGISPGQAYVYAAQQTSSAIPGGKYLPPGMHYLPQVDPFDARQREQYKNNRLLKYVTGALDLSVMAVDPTKGILKAGKAARLRFLDTKINPATGVFRTAEEAAQFEKTRAVESELRKTRAEKERALNEKQMDLVTIQKQIDDTKTQINDLATQGMIPNQDLFDQLDGLLRQQTDFTAAKKTLADEFSTAHKAWKDTLKDTYPTAAAGPGEFVDQVFTWDMTARQLVKHRTLSRFGTNTPKIASIIEAAKKTGDKIAVLDALQAAYGDVNAYARLNDSYTALHEMMRRVNNDLSALDVTVKAVKEAGGDTAEFIATSKEAMARLRNEARSLEKMDMFLGEAVAGVESTTAFGALDRGFSRFPAVEEFRAARARAVAGIETGEKFKDVVAGWSAKRFQMNRLARPVVVLSWNGAKFGKEIPSGWVHLFGLNEAEGVAEFSAMVNSVKAFSPAERQSYINAFITAGQQTTKIGVGVGDVRWALVEKTERAAFVRTAAARNPVWGEVIRDAKGKALKNADGTNMVYADQLWEMYRTKRAAQRESILANRGEENRAYGIADDGETLLHVRQWDSQLAYSIPVIDIAEVERVFAGIPKNQLAPLTGWIETLAVAKTQAVKNAARVQDALRAINDQFYRLWKPSVLLRLGYPIRNVGEGTLRSVTYHALAASLLAPYALKGVRNAGDNAIARIVGLSNEVAAWNEFRALGGNVPDSFPILRAPRKKWNAVLEATVESQATQLKFMKEHNAAVRDVVRAEAQADLDDALARIKEAKRPSASYSETDHADFVYGIQKELPKFYLGETMPIAKFESIAKKWIGEATTVVRLPENEFDRIVGTVAGKKVYAASKIVKSESLGDVPTILIRGTESEHIGVLYGYHELAHLLAGVEFGHGASFIDAFLRVLPNDYSSILGKKLAKTTKTPEEIKADLAAARKDAKDARNRLAETDDDEIWFEDGIIDAHEAQLNANKEIYQRFLDSNIRKLRTAGDEVMNIQAHEVPGVFMDTSGMALRDIVSSETRGSIDVNLRSSFENDWAKLNAKNWVKYDPPRLGTGRTAEQIAGDVEYWPQLERYIHQLRNDSLAEVIIREFDKHASLDDGLLAGLAAGQKWLKTAPGKDYLDRVRLSSEWGDDVTAEQVGFKRYEQILSAVGENDDLLRRLSGSDKIRAAELRAKLFDSEKTVPIHGEDVQHLKTAKHLENRTDKVGFYLSRLNKMYDGFVQTGFKILGSIPEDKLVRHPFANMVYTKYMTDRIAAIEASGATLTNDALMDLVANARAYTAKETRSWLYTVARKKQLAQSVSAISPFIQAQQNSISAWSRLLYENPEAFYYGQQAWRNLDKLGVVEQDPDTGETYLTFRIPDFMIRGASKLSPALGESLRTFGNWSVRKSGFNLILPGLQGDDLATQITQVAGLSPVFTVPVGNWIINNPDIDQKLYEKTGIAFPARSILSKFVPDSQLPRETSLWTLIRNQLSPAWGRNLIAAHDGQDSYRYAETMLTIAQNKFYRQNLGIDPQKSLDTIIKESQQEATMFMFVRAVNNLTLPIVPRYDSALKPYIQQLRALQDKNGPQEGFRLFVKQNPDMWYINASLTKNPSGVDSTTLSVHLAKKNSSLVDDLLSKKPKDDMKYVSLVTDTLVAGQFDTAANLWKRRSGFVERKDVQSALRDSRVAMGWLRYHEIQDKYQGELDRLKLPNMQVAAAYKLRLAKEIEINQLKKEFPAWNTEYDDVAQGRWRRNVAAVHRVAYDPAIMADVKNYPHFEKVRAYFDFRANVQKVLYAQAEYKLRAKFGDRQFPKDVVVAEMGSIESDPRLVAIRDRIVKSFRSDEMFAYIYDRFLDADQFTPIPSWKESE